MKTLTKKQLQRQDFVDNAVFDMIKLLNPSRKKIKWNIEYIGSIRDEVERIFIKELKFCGKQKFYPFLPYA